MISFTYKIINKLNGKYYIGKSNNPYKRWTDHLSIANSGKPKDGTFQAIHAAIKKYGKENFELFILEEHSSEEIALEKEVQLIKTARDNKDKIYNLTNGGEGVTGYKHSLKSKQHMSEIRRGRITSDITKTKISKALKGKIRSQQHCKALSLAKIGKSAKPSVGIKNSLRFKGEKSNTALLSEENVIDIINLINNGVRSKIIAEKYNVHHTTISNIKTGKTWSHLHYLINKTI